MLGTMPDHQLTVRDLFRHGESIHGESVVVTCGGEAAPSTRTFATVAERSARLANGLRELGVRPGDRVATLAWNHAEHLEAYLAVPCMGAVLVTLNLRLIPAQLGQIVRHSGARVLLVDASFAALAEELLAAAPELEHVVTIGDGPGGAAGHSYADLVAAGGARFEWPSLDERDAALMCYTTGTTGDPKGVAYSHRSVYLHSLMACMADAFGVCERDRLLVVVPMFHANAWGVPYAGWWMGSDLLMPRQFLQGEHLARFAERERATFVGAVPTVLDDLLRAASDAGRDLSSLRLAVGGGSAVPRTLIEGWRDRLGVELVQAWGMTETSPLAAMARPSKHSGGEEEMEDRILAGRPVAGVEMRLVGEAGESLPADGAAVGELEVRGPFVTSSYFRDSAAEKFHDGWLRTGDVGALTERGYLRITDRLKDVIKSGGEWVSSIELENALLSHPGVLEAAVIGVPDERWGERPLAFVVSRPGDGPSPRALGEHLAGQVARWWVPERWTFVAAIPRTSVGKIDKKALRELYAGGELTVSAP